jgi:hypothetical protein
MTVSIKLAVYASNNKGEDVTAEVQAMIVNGNDDVPVNNTSFGDPDNGSTKYFLVWYTADGINNGNPIGLAAVENQTADLIPSPSYPSYYFNTSVQPSLDASTIAPYQVKCAIYGSLNNGFDVTAICQAILNQGGLIVSQGNTSLQIPVNNETFGGDPDFGSTKYFAMEYVSNGVAYFQGAQEGQLLTVLAQAPAELETA